MLAYDWNFLGLSTETKPMAGEKVVDGSTFYECDTSSFFIFYHGEWYQQTFVTEDGINFWLYKALMKKMFGKWFDGNISLGKIIKPTTGTEIEFTNSLPAQITDLTGYGDTFQQTYSGKNLFGGLTYVQKSYIESWSLTNGVLSITPSDTTHNTALIFTLGKSIPAGTYTLNSANFISSSTQLRELSTTFGGGANFNDKYENATRTTTTTTTAIAFNWISTGSTDTFTVNLNTLQIEAGDQATSYEPYVGGTASPNPDYPQTVNVVTGEQTVTINEEQSYTIDLGSTELCKIGDYQDYIYKSGDDWYVRKEIDKVVFNGSENWQYNSPNQVFYLSGVDTSAKLGNPAPVSNYYIGQIIDSYAQANNNSVCIVTSTNRWVIKNTTYSTAEDFKTWLNTHNTIVYYALATPTDTKITDNTLIGELNALLNYTFPGGENHLVITADDLPMALKLTITEKE